MPDDFENSNDHDELAILIEAVIDGTISQTQFDQLSRLLADDPVARERYVAEIEIESNLRQMVRPPKAPTAKPLFPQVTTEAVDKSTNWISTGFFAIAIVALVAGFVAYQNWNNSQPDHSKIAKSNGPDVRVHDKKIETASLPIRSVARITNGQDLAWKSDRDVSIGSWLRPGNYELTAGNLEVTFDSGAVVYIAAGSAFEIINSNEVLLNCGSLEADVPEQAIGFKVRTPSGEITDLSTKFGVKVSQKGESDVHVIKGLVEAKPSISSAGQLVTLKEKTALRMFVDSPPEAVEFSPKRLFEIGSRNNQGKLNYLHFSFDDQNVSEGLLNNSGPGAQGHGGRIVDGNAPNSWVQVDGTFGKALFFSGEGAKIQTHIKGIEGRQPRTLMFWVRINPETPIRSAYSFASWGLSEAGPSPAGQKWQIGWNPNFQSDDEGVMGAVRTEFGGGYVIGSTDLRDGRWHHIASVFIGGDNDDDVSNLIRHYVDGKLESVSGFKAKKRIMTESSQRSLTIGDYVGAGEDTFTGYKGWIDEFYLFDKALTPSQIVQVMEQNKPPAAQEIVADQSEE